MNSSDATKRGAAAAVFGLLAGVGAAATFLGVGWLLAQVVNWMILHLRIAIV